LQGIYIGFLCYMPCVVIKNHLIRTRINHENLTRPIEIMNIDGIVNDNARLL